MSSTKLLSQTASFVRMLQVGQRKTFTKRLSPWSLRIVTQVFISLLHRLVLACRVDGEFPLAGLSLATEERALEETDRHDTAVQISPNATPKSAGPTLSPSRRTTTLGVQLLYKVKKRDDKVSTTSSRRRAEPAC